MHGIRRLCQARPSQHRFQMWTDNFLNGGVGVNLGNFTVDAAVSYLHADERTGLQADPFGVPKPLHARRQGDLQGRLYRCGDSRRLHFW